MAQIAALALGLLLGGQANAAQWLAGIEEGEGQLTVTAGGTAAVGGSFAFWGPRWEWAGQATRFQVIGPSSYLITGTNRKLGMALSAEVAVLSQRALQWKFALDARQAHSDVIGGGLRFTFDLAAADRAMGEPELLPGNRGWAWGKPGGRRMEMRFEPPLETVYFERGRKSELRAFFYKDAIPAGQRHYVATFTVSGDIAIGGAPSERFGGSAPATWPRDILGATASPVDLSFLNAGDRPAGRRGFVRVQDGRLAFEDGSPARFWGANLSAYALFSTDRENVRRHAKRLAALGFNLVRLHHHDSSWVNPNVFGDAKTSHTGTLSSAMLDRLDWWIKCLKDEGIYVWLDLHVQRHLKAGDRIADFDEIAKGKPGADLKGYNFVNPTIAQAMDRFNAAFLSHGNHYTGLRYAEDPAVVALLLSNENDLTQHYGNALLPDKGVPRHNAVYMREAQAFAAKHGLSRDRVWRSWEPGPSKLFLNDLEQRFFAGQIAHVRAQGARALVATTSAWGNAPLSSLPALAAGDFIDVHSYGGAGELEKDPQVAPSFVHWIAASRVAGRPLTVSEWNVEKFPVVDRHSAPLYIAASARLQGWDALLLYAYGQGPLNGRGDPSNWHMFNDPALAATMPAAALLYRQGHVREAETIYAFSPTPEQLFNHMLSAKTSLALRTAAERGRVVVVLPKVRELPWLAAGSAPPKSVRIAASDQSLLPPGAAEAASDTGELHRNWRRGTYVIDSPRTQAATGWIGGTTIQLRDVDLRVATRNASVAVQALDGKPIAESRRIMVSLGARSQPLTPTQLPYLSEPVEGTLSIRAPEGLRLYAERMEQGAPGYSAVPLPARYASGRYHVELQAARGTYWLVLR